MTRPTSRLTWSPDQSDGRTIRAMWVGAGWHYTVHWGDGTTDERMFWQPPVAHTYAKAGTYDLVCVSTISREVTVSEKITVREWARPPQPAAHLDGQVLTLDMPAVPEPVRWRVFWGDDTSSEHGPGEQPSNTYPWNFGTPSITVWDVPSRRAVGFDGPQIGPSPPPPPELPVNGFLVRWWRTTADGTEFELLGGGREPGEQITFYPRRSWADAVPLVADSSGKVRYLFTRPTSPNGPDWDDSWRSYSLKHKWGWEFLPVHPVKMRADEPQVTYTVSPNNPLDVNLGVYPHQPGVHYVHFGDGFDVRVNATELPLRVSHNYAYKRPDRPITIFLPDGRKAVRSFDKPAPCPPAYNPNYPGEVTIAWKRADTPCGGDTEGFAPVYVDNGGIHPPHVLHRPTNTDSTGTAYLYTGLAAGTHTFTYGAFDQDTRHHQVMVSKGGRQRSAGDGEITEDAPEPGMITAWFGDVQEWDGGYSGTFHVYNHTKEARPWAIEFELDDPAVLREVWPSHAQFKELGGGRWRIWSATPIPASTDVAVGARVEPPGKTRKWPDGIVARWWGKPVEEDG